MQRDGLQAQKDADRSGLVRYCPYPTPQRRILGIGDMEHIGLNTANHAVANVMSDSGVSA